MSNINDKGKLPEKDLLTSLQMQTLTDSVVRSFDIELARITVDKNRTRIFDRYLEIYHAANYYTFFTPASMYEVTTLLFSDQVHRDFIMNLTERVSIELSTQDLSFDDSLINSFVKAITNNKVPVSGSRNCLINKEVRESIEISQDVARSVLLDNLWFLVLYVLTVYFQRSVFFQKYTEKTSEATT